MGGGGGGGGLREGIDDGTAETKVILHHRLQQGPDGFAQRRRPGIKQSAMATNICKLRMGRQEMVSIRRTAEINRKSPQLCFWGKTPPSPPLHHSRASLYSTLFFT